jgi:hypothetical protein
VRNREDIAAGSGIEAIFREPLPELVVMGCFDVADGDVEHDVAAEDHVAVQIRAEPEGAVLVADEAGVLTGRVPSLGRVLDRLPEPIAFGAAVLAVGATRLFVVPGKGRDDLLGQLPGVLADVRSHDLAYVARVPGGSLVGADAHLPEHLGVVGHGHEVEGARSLVAPGRAALRVEGG